MVKLLNGKKGIIFGVANELSLAWGIAKEAYNHGAEIALACRGQRSIDRVTPIAAEVGCNSIYECNVVDEESVKQLFDQLKDKWGTIDFLVHSVAFIKKDELQGRFIDTNANNFLLGMHTSALSLVTLSRYAEPIMSNEGSIITLSYYGAEKVVPNYNAMGVIKSALESTVRYLAADLGPNNVRVNAISAGPIKTIAASVIGDFNKMLEVNRNTAPLRRNITQSDVGKAAVYFLSNLSSGVTGETHYVDCGYNKMGFNR